MRFVIERIHRLCMTSQHYSCRHAGCLSATSPVDKRDTLSDTEVQPTRPGRANRRFDEPSLGHRRRCRRCFSPTNSRPRRYKSTVPRYHSQTARYPPRGRCGTRRYTSEISMAASGHQLYPKRVHRHPNRHSKPGFVGYSVAGKQFFAGNRGSCPHGCWVSRAKLQTRCHPDHAPGPSKIIKKPKTEPHRATYDGLHDAESILADSAAVPPQSIAEPAPPGTI